MVSSNKSKTHSLSSIHSSIVTELKTHNLYVDPDRKPLDSPLGIFQQLIESRFSKNNNKKTLLLDSLYKMQDERAAFPDWAREVVEKDSDLFALQSGELMRRRDCLFMVYACKLSSLGVTLFYSRGGTLRSAVFEHTSINHSHWLLDNGRYHRLYNQPRKHGKNGQAYHYDPPETYAAELDSQHVVGAQQRPQDYGPNKYLERAEQRGQYGDLKGKVYRSTGSELQTTDPFSLLYLNKPKSNGYLTYRQMPGNFDHFERRGDANAPKLKYSTAFSNLQNVDHNTKLLNKVTDSRYLRDTDPGPDDPRPNKPRFEENEAGEDPNTTEDFQKAVNYIAVYQQRFRKTLRSMAKGKVCELKSEDVSKEYFTAYLKFYNEKSKFGFIRGENGEEVFLHKDNLIKSRIDSQMLECCSQFFDILLKYQKLCYKGKGETSVKAVNLEIVNFIPKMN